METNNEQALSQPILSAGVASEFDELRKLAQAATPGEWETRRETDDEMSLIGYSVHAVSGKTIYDDCDAPSMADAQFIAAANPAAILRLLDRAALASAPAAPVMTDAIPANLREFVEAIAYTYDRDDGENESVCLGCSGLIEHDAGANKEYAHHRPDCIVLRAQAVLASMSADAQSKGATDE